MKYTIYIWSPISVLHLVCNIQFANIIDQTCQYLIFHTSQVLICLDSSSHVLLWFEVHEILFTIIRIKVQFEFQNGSFIFLGHTHIYYKTCTNINTRVARCKAILVFPLIWPETFLNPSSTSYTQRTTHTPQKEMSCLLYYSSINGEIIW